MNEITRWVAIFDAREEAAREDRIHAMSHAFGCGAVGDYLKQQKTFEQLKADERIRLQAERIEREADAAASKAFEQARQRGIQNAAARVAPVDVDQEQPEVAAPAQTPAPEVADEAVVKTEVAEKPLQRTAAQDAAILGEIKKQGLDPLALPKNPTGKPGVKLAIRTALKSNSLFVGGTVFNKAWERLTARADIEIQG